MASLIVQHLFAVQPFDFHDVFRLIDLITQMLAPAAQHFVQFGLVTATVKTCLRTAAALGASPATAQQLLLVALADLPRSYVVLAQPSMPPTCYPPLCIPPGRNRFRRALALPLMHLPSDRATKVCRAMDRSSSIYLRARPSGNQPTCCQRQLITPHNARPTLLTSTPTI